VGGEDESGCSDCGGCVAGLTGDGDLVSLGGGVGLARANAVGRWVGSTTV